MFNTPPTPLNSFNLPTPLGNQLLTRNIFGGASNNSTVVSNPDIFGNQEIYISDGGAGAKGTISQDIFGRQIIKYHKIW